MTSKLDYSDVDGTKERIVGVFDVLGFRKALKDRGANKLVRLYATAIGKTQSVLQETKEEVYMFVPPEFIEDEGFPGSADTFAVPRSVQVSVFPGVEKLVIFSDSIFLFGADDSPASLRDVLRSAVVLFRVFLEIGLPLAGAIARGDAVVDPRLEIYAGNGIVSAYELANTVDIVGLVIHADVQKLDGFMSEPVTIRRKRDRKCRARAPVKLRVPVAPSNDPQLLQVEAAWKGIVKQQVEIASADRKALAKWKHSAKVLSALLGAKIEIQ